MDVVSMKQKKTSALSHSYSDKKKKLFNSINVLHFKTWICN